MANRKDTKMNIQRRKRISAIINDISVLSEKMESILNDIEEVKDEEEEYLDNIPENLSGSERYEKAEGAVENLDDACCQMQESLDYLEDIASALEEAAN